MSKKIEVELRGPLEKKDYLRLNRFFKAKGRFIKDKSRIVVCYPDPETGSYVEELKTDIRIRSTNGFSELIIKLGNWGGKENRRELSLSAGKNEFDKLAMMMGAMGFTEGILAIRKGKIYHYQDAEFSLVEVPGHSFYYEAEVMVEKKSEIAKAEKHLRQICGGLGLDSFSDQNFYSYINRLNEEANEIYKFENYKEGDFKRRFKI